MYTSLDLINGYKRLTILINPFSSLTLLQACFFPIVTQQLLSFTLAVRLVY